MTFERKQDCKCASCAGGYGECEKCGLENCAHAQWHGYMCNIEAVNKRNARYDRKIRNTFIVGEHDGE